MKHGATPLRIIREAEARLAQIKRSVVRGWLKAAKMIGLRVGRWRNQWKAGRYFGVDIGEGKFEYWLKDENFDLARDLCRKFQNA